MSFGFIRMSESLMKVPYSQADGAYCGLLREESAPRTRIDDYRQLVTRRPDVQQVNRYYGT